MSRTPWGAIRDYDKGPINLEYLKGAVPWWFKYHALDFVRYDIKRGFWHKFRRAQRGWSEEDAWNGYNHVASVIAGLARWHQGNTISFPIFWDESIPPEDQDFDNHMEPDASIEKWNAILGEIIVGMDLLNDLDRWWTKEDQAKIDRAWELWVENYRNFWD